MGFSSALRSGSSEDFHVLVIGAGSTGLLIGQGLKQAGISFGIYEKSDHDTYQNRQRDWTMALHWGSEYLQTCLPANLLDNLRDAEPDPWTVLSKEQETQFPICDGSSGEVLVQAQAATTRRVSREKLRKLIAQGLDVRYGSKVVDIRDGGDVVSVHFEDGHVATGHALVGCDSASSFVRTYLLGKQKGSCEVFPVIPYNFTCRYTSEQALYLQRALHPLLKAAVHPDQNTWYMLAMMDMKDPNDPSTWVFHNFLNLWDDDLTNIPRTTEERLKHFKSIAKNYCEPFKSASQWVPDDTKIPFDQIKHWPGICQWNNHEGRITLAGDAAHPMVPYRGQGLNNGQQDAAAYVNALQSVVAATKDVSTYPQELKEAIDKYDAEVLIRGRKEIALSADQGYRSMHMDAFMSSPMAKYGLNKVQE